MATLTDRIDAQVSALNAERARIEAQHEENLAAVDAKLAVLAAAKKLITRDLEQAYTALLGFGLIREV
jgi:hypothetical protein